MASTFSSWSLGTVCLLSFITLAISQDRYVHDKKVSFYVDVNMTCDHPDLNITRRTDIQSLSWILPNGLTVDSESYLDPSLYSLAGPPSDMPVTGDRSMLDAYTLKAFEIDSDVFGYYSCVIVYTTPTKPISVVRWGLNANGASFDELMDVYREGAIVGGVAAGVFFVLVVGTCLVWHYCFAERPEDVSEDGDIEEKKKGSKEKEHAYNNTAYNGDVDAADVGVSLDNEAGKKGIITKM